MRRVSLGVRPGRRRPATEPRADRSEASQQPWGSHGSAIGASAVIRTGSERGGIGGERAPRSGRPTGSAATPDSMGLAGRIRRLPPICSAGSVRQAGVADVAGQRRLGIERLGAHVTNEGLTVSGRGDHGGGHFLPCQEALRHVVGCPQHIGAIQVVVGRRPAEPVDPGWGRHVTGRVRARAASRCPLITGPSTAGSRVRTAGAHPAR